MRLIDFGLASSFLDEQGNHIKERKSPFSGNLFFGSRNTLMKISPTRRDDLVSLAYLLVYLYTGELWFVEECEKRPNGEAEKNISNAKIIASPKDVCYKAPEFLDFVEEVYSLSFSQSPDYQ